MFMPHRGLRAICFILSLLASAITSAEEIVTLADDLANPTAVVASSATDGGVRVVVAESGTEQLTEFNLLGEAVLTRTAVGRFDVDGVVALARLNQNCVVMGSSGTETVALGEEESSKPVVGPAVRGSVAINKRWLFAPSERSLLRGSVASDEVTKLRPIATMPTTLLAITFSPEGYLVVVVDTKSGEQRLQFYDPEVPEQAIADYPLQKIERPIAIAYGSNPTSLYVLNHAAEGGLLRIDVSLSGNRTGATATPVISLDSPTSLAVLPDGSLVVTTSDGERGQLLKITHLP